MLQNAKQFMAEHPEVEDAIITRDPLSEEYVYHVQLRTGGIGATFDGWEDALWYAQQNEKECAAK